MAIPTTVRFISNTRTKEVTYSNWYVACENAIAGIELSNLLIKEDEDLKFTLNGERIIKCEIYRTDLGMETPNRVYYALDNPTRKRFYRIG